MKEDTSRHPVAQVITASSSSWSPRSTASDDGASRSKILPFYIKSEFVDIWYHYCTSCKARERAFILPSITSGFEANLCAYDFCISARKASSSITPDTFTIAASIGEFGKYFPSASKEIFLASIVLLIAQTIVCSNRRTHSLWTIFRESLHIHSSTESYISKQKCRDHASGFQLNLSCYPPICILCTLKMLSNRNYISVLDCVWKIKKHFQIRSDSRNSESTFLPK